MQFKTIFTVLATAALAMGAAVPEPGHPNPYPPKPKPKPTPAPPAPAPPSSGCQTGSVSSCCTGKFLFGFDCILNILSNTCSIGSTACCPTNQSGLINIGSICIPITL